MNDFLALKREYQKLQLAYLAQQRELNALQTTMVQQSLAEVEAEITKQTEE